MEAMDFMDPRQRRRHDIMLLIGYVLICLVILMLTTILIFVAYGFGYKNGQVIQNGLVFLSSSPNPAQININNAHYKSNTNTRIILPEGTYKFNLQRNGYRNWQKTIIITGGQVESYDYPYLIPNSITTSTKQEYEKAPSLVTQSPDRRWLLVARPSSITSYDVYDLNNPKQFQTLIAIPAALISPATASQNLQVVGWSNDNVHVLLKHTYDDKTEYILFNRSSPDQSLNLTKTLSIATSGIDVKLNNKKYDQYLIYDNVKQVLFRATLNSPQLQAYVDKVLTYASYGDNTILYATPDVTDANKVNINLYDGSNTYTIRRAAANTSYLLNLTTYSGDLYVAISASSENMAYIYKNPVNQLSNNQLGVAIPLRVFRIKAPNYVAFSANTQYIMFENGTNFAVYDAENQEGFTYNSPDQLDQPQTHAFWMDGARLVYVSKGQATVFDYDGNNRQILVSADPTYQTYFDRNFKYMYNLTNLSTNKTHELLTSTPMRIPSDM